MTFRCFNCSGRALIYHCNKWCSTCHHSVEFCSSCDINKWPPFGWRRTETTCQQCISKRRNDWLARVSSFIASDWCAVLPVNLVRQYLVPALYRSNPPPLTSYWHTGKIRLSYVPYCFCCAARVPNDNFMRYDCSVCKLRYNSCPSCDCMSEAVCIFCKNAAVL
jgi:hypothetical protein